MQDRRNRGIIQPPVTFSLEPGQIVLSKEPDIIRTILGSCVSVCLWCAKMKCGSMNHFMYPRTDNPREATPRYGNASMVALLRLMYEEGCAREDIVAQLFGGSFPKGARGRNIGEENIDVARSYLDRHSIPLVSQDVGGMLGRKILFDTQSGHVAVLKVHSLRAQDWPSVVW
ncbi:MAG: chemotaxis protein CheD [Fibrobacterota bacterium]